MTLSSSSPLLEVAAFDLPSALAASAAGADRLEVCQAATFGGLTPPLGWVERIAAECDTPFAVMVREHARGWSFTDAEHEIMRHDAIRFVRAGATAVVWGALLPDGTVDANALRRLADAVAPAPVVFHRAFDAARDLDEALDALADGGVARVLTGGGPGRALSNVQRLAELVRRAGSRLTVMPGGGIRASNVAELVRRTGAREVHSGASAPGSVQVDPAEVARLLRALR